MVKISVFLFLLINFSVLNSAPLDGSCFYLVNKGLSRSISVDLNNPNIPLTLDTLTYTDNQVICAYLNTDKISYTLNFLRYPFKNLQFNQNDLLIQVDTNYKNNQITQNFEDTPINQRFTFTLDNGDYLINSVENKKYLTGQQGSNSISRNPLLSNCLQRWTLINVDNYSWNENCLFIQHKKSGKFINFENSFTGDLKLGEFDPRTSRTCLRNGNRNSYNFVNQLGGPETIMYFDIYKFIESDGTKVIKWVNNGGYKNQRFSLIPINLKNMTSPDFYIVSYVGKNIESKNQVDLIHNSNFNENQIFTLYLA